MTAELRYEVHQRRQARADRRIERIRKEQRRERMLAPVKLTAKVVGGGLILYAYLLIGSLWAAI